MGTRTHLFCVKLAEKNEVKDNYPLEKGQSSPNFCIFTQMNNLQDKTIVTQRSHPNTEVACIIKWTTSGEPPVASRSQWLSYFRRIK